MNELQKCQFKILKEFIRVCKENNLQYYLVGGTCLGAVRHKGFIPWDDDIDVAMPRKDFEKFVTLQDKFKEKYFIQTYKTDKNFIYNYAKVRDSSTTYIENFYACHQFNHGVWSDVLPLDGMSYVDMPAKKLAKKVNHLWFDTYLMYLPSLKRKLRLKTLWKDIPLNIVAYLFFFLNVGHYRNKLIDKRNKKIDYDKAYLVGNICGTNPKKEAMPRVIFEEGTVGEFEGIEVILPKDYDKYLTLLFKDYMKLPPEDKRYGHHKHAGYSLTESYVDYIKKHNI